MEHPENYPQLTIRVSGYAVNFVRLTREQQLDVDQPHLPRAAVTHAAVIERARGPARSRPCRPAAEVTGSVHSWDISTGVDGPGTRFVVFLAGCPLRCLYCHNPDTWSGRSGGG